MIDHVPVLVDDREELVDHLGDFLEMGRYVAERRHAIGGGDVEDARLPGRNCDGAHAAGHDGPGRCRKSRRDPASYGGMLGYRRLLALGAALLAGLTLACDGGGRSAGLDLLEARVGLAPVVWPGTRTLPNSPQIAASWDFEGPSPHPWMLATQQGQVRRVRPRGPEHGPGRVLCLESRGGPADADVRTHVTVKPSATYRLEGKLSTRDLAPETAEVYGTLYLGEFDYLRSDNRDENDATYWHRNLPMSAGTSEGWQEIRYQFRTQAGTRMLRIAASLGNWGTAAGRVCIDDVRLIELAPRERGDPAHLVQEALVSGEFRRALRAEPPSVYGAALRVPDGARLRFAPGIEGIGRAGDAGGVRFEVELVSGDVRHRLYTQHVTRRDGWIEADVSLEAYAGRNVELFFRTSRSPRALDPSPHASELAVWGHPRVWVPRAAEDGEVAPDVFLITVDTLRADHLGCYGYARDTSPSIDALASEGILIERAFTSVPRTTPALASLMTGDPPRKHGLMTLLDSLPSENRTLAEALREQGYATAAFVTPNVPARSGLWQGFDVFDDRESSGDSSARAERVASRALAWVEAQRGGRIFLWVHLWDPHFRYDPPPPHDQLFDPQPGEPLSLYRRLDRDELRLGQVYFENDLSPEEVARVVARYDGEIHYADQVIGRFLQRLRDLGLYAAALVVFTADHGESLGEHGYHFEHGEYLYDASLRIPLILKLPQGRRAGTRIAGPALIYDVAPTVSSVASLGAGVGSAGLDLSSASESGGPLRETSFHESGHRFFAENRRRPIEGPEGHWKSVREGHWKLIRIPAPDGDIHELYDLDADPGETRNLFRAEDPHGRALVRKLDAWLAGFRAAPKRSRASDAIDPATAERLRALGYMD
jgi:arylsulfatase A-like enzyme